MKPKISLGSAILLRVAIALGIFLSVSPALAAPDPPARADAPDPMVPLVTSYGTEFVHIANSVNTGGYVTTIDNPLTNGNPNAILIVTPNFNPGAAAGGVYNDHPIGVYYDGTNWHIFNQDLATMPVDAAFNVLIPNAGAGVFVHTTTAGNRECGGLQCTIIDNALSNNNPNALVFVTPDWNPGGIFNNHPIGVGYDGTKWYIFNQDIVAMPLGAAFNVMILSAGPGVFVQTATTGNTYSNRTYIDNPLTNNNPYPILFATPNYDPGGSGGTYDNNNIGVYYETLVSVNKMAVFNQHLASPMPVNAAFNVLIAPTNMAVFVHYAATENISLNHTYIDNPISNNNPNAIVLVTPNWNPDDSAGVYYDHPFGVYYASALGKWAIFNQEGRLSSMPLGSAFNVLVFATDVGEFVHKATASNSTGDYTTMYHPLTNNIPNAIVFATPNWNPGGGSSGTYNNHPIGVWYTGAQWAIFNQDLAAVPANASFNVFVPPSSPAVFVHTATAGNIGGTQCPLNNCTWIDNPQTNRNPAALLFVTPNYDPGGIVGTYDNDNIGVYYDYTHSKWAIFNQDLAAMPVNASFNVFVTGNHLMLPLILR